MPQLQSKGHNGAYGHDHSCRCRQPLFVVRFFIISLVFLLGLGRLFHSTTTRPPPCTLKTKSAEHYSVGNQKCREGYFDLITAASPFSGWKERFPPRHINREKVLLAMPVGTTGASSVDRLITHFVDKNTTNVDFLLFQYDDYPHWQNFSWSSHVQWRVTPKGRKWKLAKEYLQPWNVPDYYSHICFWDDDIQPAGDLFDGDVFIRTLQGLNLSIAQPAIRRGCHSIFTQLCWNDTYDTTIMAHSSLMVEIMTPCYNRETWRRYIWPNILETDDGSGWGIDFVLHPLAGERYILHQPVDHMDHKSLKHKGSGGILSKYAQLGDIQGWTYYREAPQEPPPTFYRLHVDSNCQQSLVPV